MLDSAPFRRPKGHSYPCAGVVGKKWPHFTCLGNSSFGWSWWWGVYLAYLAYLRQVRKREDDDKAKALSGTKLKLDTSGTEVQLTLAPEWSI